MHNQKIALVENSRKRWIPACPAFFLMFIQNVARPENFENMKVEKFLRSKCKKLGIQQKIHETQPKYRETQY